MLAFALNKNADADPHLRETDRVPEERRADEDRENSAWLLWIGVGSGVLVLVMLGVVILGPTFGAFVGVEVPGADMGIVAMMFTYVVMAFGLIPKRSREVIAIRIFGRKKDD